MERLVATYLFDSSTVYREGLKSILSGTRFRIVRQYDLADVSTFELPKTKWRELLFAIGVEGDVERAASVFQWCAAIQAPKRIALISNHAELDQVLKAVRLGADGYLLRSMNSATLLKSLELVALGERMIPSAITYLLCDRACEMADGGAQQAGNDVGIELHETGNQAREMQGCNSFSGREAAVLNRLMNGESNKSIARKLQIAEATVKVHVKAILRKIQAKNRTQAAMWAANHHWTAPIDTAGSNGFELGDNQYDN